MNYFALSTASSRGAWWFHPEDHTFEGFRLTHQPSPWMGDFSHFTMTPFSGYLGGHSIWHTVSSFRPSETQMSPHKIAITSLRYQIQSILVPSIYGGILQMKFLNSKVQDNGIILQLPGNFEISAKDSRNILFSVSNYADCEDENFAFYVQLAFENDIVLDSVFEVEDGQENQVLSDGSNSFKGKNGAVQVTFKTLLKQIQTVRFGTSFISFDQASLNLEREHSMTLDEYEVQNEEAWEKQLNKIEVEHDDPKIVSTFYHNLYRSFLFPQRFYEIDHNNQKIHFDTSSRTVKPGPLYTNNGFWDTFRTVYPLYSLIAVEEYGDMLEGFLNSFRESGYLPKWLSPDERGMMPGTLIDAVIADASKKEIRLDLMPEFLEAMIKGATVQSSDPKYGRQGISDYLEYGYVPLNHHESVNQTLDYSYSDYCIYRVAQILGDQNTSQYYKKQALNYCHLYDSESGFMRAKDHDGKFRENFNPLQWGRDYAEGSAWQTSFSVFQDFAGLIKIHGGADLFEEMLIELCNQKPDFSVEGYGFEIHEMSEMAALEFGQVAISNQPSFHYPYLFSYIGKPWMAQPLIKNLLLETFNDTTRAYPGDEDNGTMASWYIFSSLGFYPMTAGTGEYILGIPLWNRAKIHLSNGKMVEINSSPNKKQHVFVDTVSADGKKIENTFIDHKDLTTGLRLDFKLGIVPHPQTYLPEQLPFSLTKNDLKTTVSKS